MNKVICSDCGKEFECENNEGVFTPSACPNCGKDVLAISTTPTTEEKLAQVEE